MKWTNILCIVFLTIMFLEPNCWAQCVGIIVFAPFGWTAYLIYDNFMRRY